MQSLDRRRKIWRMKWDGIKKGKNWKGYNHQRFEGWKEMEKSDKEMDERRWKDEGLIIIPFSVFPFLYLSLLFFFYSLSNSSLYFYVLSVIYIFREENKQKFNQVNSKQTCRSVYIILSLTKHVVGISKIPSVVNF